MIEHTIDANNRSLGRVATEAAVILRGKNSVNFAPNKAPDVKVVVVNADKIKTTGRKMEQKEYKRYSGYPGGLKTETMSEIVEKKGMPYALRKAVEGMIPRNRLRKIIMKNLIIKK